MGTRETGSQKRAQAGVDRMTETQHAALPQQHVVRQAGNDGYPHLRQDGDGKAAVEHQRHYRQNQRKQGPDNPSADIVGFEMVSISHGLISARP
jgi:hypothetical protein